MKNILKNFLVLLLAIFATCSMNLIILDNATIGEMLFNDNSEPTLYKLVYDFNTDGEVYESYYPTNRINHIILFIIMFFVIRFAIDIKDIRLRYCALSLAILFSIFEIIGNSIALYTSVRVIMEQWIISLFKFIGLIIGYYSIIASLFKKISDFNNKVVKKDNKENIFFTKNKKSIFSVTLFILICWLPYFLKEFPGITEYDAIMQIGQIKGTIEMSQWHPYIHTLLIKLCYNIGNLIFGNINAGVAIYTIIQMIIMALIFSITIYYLAKKEVDSKIRFILLLYFSFSPSIIINCLTMQKDVIFGGLMILFCIIFIEMLTNSKSFFENKRNIIITLLIFTLTILFRNNAIYMFVIIIPFIVIYKKEYRLEVSLLLSGALLSILIIYFLFTNILNIEKPRKVEVLSVPIQQIVRAGVDNKVTLTKDDFDIIKKFFYGIEDSEIFDFYRPFISDPVKLKFNIEYYEENKIEFFKLWWDFFLKYPISYIDAFFGTCSGYLDVKETRNLSMLVGTFENSLEIEANPILELKFVSFMENLKDNLQIPIIELLFNTAINFWIILFLLTYLIYKKKYNFVVAFIPMIVYFLTVLLGPLNGEYRYIFFTSTTMPLILGITLINENKAEKEIKDD